MTGFAMLFPGQGSQRVGMLKDWAERYTCVRELIEEADSILQRPLSTLMGQGPSCELDQTQNTQPAMLLADVALWRVWLEEGGAQPAVVAGHSLGEYAAAVAAGVLEFAAALRIVAVRARAMQEAVPKGTGAMAAVVGLDAARVEQLCAAHSAGIVDAVNMNAPTQVVIAGEVAAVDVVCSAAKDAGARMARRLPVSVPAHSRLMRTARGPLEAAFGEESWSDSQCPLLHNVDAQVRQGTANIQAALLDQVHSPVQWVRTQQRIQAEFGCARAVECGPGNVLAGLGRRSGVELAVQAFPAPEGLAQTMQWVQGL